VLVGRAEFNAAAGCREQALKEVQEVFEADWFGNLPLTDSRQRHGGLASLPLFTSALFCFKGFFDHATVTCDRWKEFSLFA
jgi:hypothetical protein